MRRERYEVRDMFATGWMARLWGRRAWLRHWAGVCAALYDDVAAAPAPSFSTRRFTEVGTARRQRRSPIRWSSQMLSLK